MTNLYSCTQDNVTLEEAIEQCIKYNYLHEAVGLFYSRGWCGFAKLKETGKVNIFDGVENSEAEISLASVFEARIFNETAELRWLKQSNDRGYAALLSDSQKVNCFDTELETLENLESLHQKYLLWGEGTNTNLGDGWSRLATARIGKLDVPISGLLHQDRVLLESIEYLGVPEEDDYGNVVVLEERLVGLKRVIFKGVKQDDAIK